ncbi:MAG: mechanosensitive ion channel family protein [Candidatus Nanohaloarchaea archaeon]
MVPGIETLLNSEQLYLRLARFLLALILGVVLTQVVVRPVTRVLLERRYKDKKTVQSLLNVVETAVLFVVLVMSLQIGSFGNLTTVIGTIAAALTVAVGFGMRDQVASIVAGVFIQLDNPFVKGDYVKVQDFEGVVEEIELRATTLNGSSSEKMVVPNNLLVSNVMKNFTKGSKTKTSIELSLEPADLEEHVELLLGAAEEEEKVLEKPEPEVVYIKMSDGKMVSELRYWIRDSEDLKKVRSRVLDSYRSKADQKNLFQEEN